MFFDRLRKSSWIIAIFFIAHLSACGDDAPGESDTQNNHAADTGWLDALGDAEHLDTREDIDALSDSSGEDTLDAEDQEDAADSETVDTDIIAPPAATDYTVCASELDCPINGSTCVTNVPFNRPGFDGVSEVAVSELFEQVAEGQGVCSRPCSADPTVCGDVRWPDDRGQNQPSVRVVVATGEPGYRVDSLEPFEAAVDLDELSAGQAFGALCIDRKSTRLNSSHVRISYAVFCLKKKK